MDRMQAAGTLERDSLRRGGLAIGRATRSRTERVGILVNCAAQFHRRNPCAAGEMARMTDSWGGIGILVNCPSIESLPRIARDFRRQGIEILAVSGGDGTLSHAVTAFANVYGDQPLPKIALLRGGTMNTVANACGVSRGRPAQILGRILHAYVSGRPMPVTIRRTMRINGQCGFLFGMGAAYKFLDAYYSEGRPFPTPWTAAKILGRSILSALTHGPYVRRLTDPVEADVTVDGVPWPRKKYFGVAAGTIDQMGFGFRPFHRVRESVDHFQINGYACTPSQFVTQLLRARRGQAMRYTTSALAVESMISSPDGRVCYTIDGELYESSGPVTITCGPKVRIVVPP